MLFFKIKYRNFQMSWSSILKETLCNLVCLVISIVFASICSKFYDDTLFSDDKLKKKLGNVIILCSVRFQHRRSSFKELQYICDGDSNGVLYFAGTSYGEHPWVNPVLAKVNSLDYFILFYFIFLVGGAAKD